MTRSTSSATTRDGSGVVERTELFIDGGWVSTRGGDIVDVRNPASGDLVGRAALGTPADIDVAVGAAQRSFESRVWQDTPTAERATVLERAADHLEARGAELVDLMTRELGCTRAFSERTHVPNPIRHLRTSAELIRTVSLQERLSAGGGHSLVMKEPVGVVGAVTPWNGPLSGPAVKIAPALAAGCSVVAKPSPETPLIVHALADAFQHAGLPPGVLNIVPGGRETGRALVADPRVDKVAFTGSTAAGKHIAEACGSRIARVTLELGGKSAAIVLPGADIEATAKALVPMAMVVNGQVCISQSRILVHTSIHDAVVDALAAEISGLVVGDPMASTTDIGPLVSQAQRKRVEGYIELGRAEGARAVVGGGRPSGLNSGWFVQPTLFDRVSNKMRIAREEIFGPVMATLAFDDVDEAVAIANDSPYGLSGSVWGDPDQALGVARLVRTGMVSINGAPQAWGSPFGGFKQSGIGREMGRAGLESYFETKSIAVDESLLVRSRRS